jgi:hypothetical protein
MIIWFVVGLIVWILCILFMLAIFKGGNTTRGRKQEPYFRYVGKTGNVEDSVREVRKRAELVLHS